MAPILVIHGAGMNMRGKAQIELFGPMTLPEYDVQLRKYASELGVELEIFQSNIEGEVVNRLYEAHDAGVLGCLINPAGFTVGCHVLNTAISQVKFPILEVHVSNPALRGRISDVGRHTRGVISGCGLFGYSLGMRALLELTKAAKA